MVLSLDKGERGKKQPKGIEEVKASQPENRFDIDNLNKAANHQDIKPKRGKGRPRKNKSTKMIRVSDEAVDIINAYKQATGQYHYLSEKCKLNHKMMPSSMFSEDMLLTVD